MITTLTVAFAKYLNTPMEKFSEVYRQAMGLFQLMDGHNEEDEKILNNMQNKLSDSLPISLFIVDRDINPTKGEFKTSVQKVRYLLRMSDGSKVEKDYTDSQLQSELCRASIIIHQIVMRNMKNYQLEQPVGTQSNELSSDIMKLLNV